MGRSVLDGRIRLDSSDEVGGVEAQPFGEGKQTGQRRRDPAVLDLRHERARSRRAERRLAEPRGDPSSTNPFADGQPGLRPEKIGNCVFRYT
jgi:hypothetical protein